MPVVLKFDGAPRVFTEFQVEPFREDYIPGSTVLCREANRDGQVIFFQIPNHIAQTIGKDNLDGLKKQVHEWWETR